MISVLSWLLWTIVALNAISWLVISLAPGDPGGRWLYRVQGLIWLLGVIATATFRLSKFHLLWVYPLGALVPYALMNLQIQRELNRVDAPIALAIRRHLEEHSGGVVWSRPEMQSVFKAGKSMSPLQYAKTFRASEVAGWWVTKEPTVGQVQVVRRADGVKGTLLFNDRPRFYFCWKPD